MESPTPPASPEDSPGSRLLALFGTRRLSPAQRLIARYLIEHPREALFLSSTELAERVGVSQPSVSRFAMALGFGGYGALKERMRTLLLESRDGEEPNTFQLAVDTEIRNLGALRAALADPTEILKLGGGLARSIPLVVLGLRASAPLATYFSFFCAKVHPDVRMVGEAGSPGADRIAQARMAGAKWLLAFLLPRYPRESVELMEEARRLGMRTAVVTDSAQAPVGDLADSVLTAAVGTELVFDSQAAPMLVATMLLEAISEAEPSRAQARLEDFERRAAEQTIFATS